MIITIELERLIRIIEKTNDREALKEIYEWLTENDKMRYVPRRLWPKLIDSLGSEPMTKEDEEAIREALNDDEIIHEDLKRELGL